MSYLRAVTHLPTSALEAAAYRNRAVFEKEVRQMPDGTEALFLRGPKDATDDNWIEDVRHVDYPVLAAKEWQAAKNALVHVRRAVQADMDRVPQYAGQELGPLGKAMIARLVPQGHIDWHIDHGTYAAKHWRFHLPLVTNPLAYAYAPGEAFHFPVGALFFQPSQILHSFVNFGQHAALHLVVDFRMPEAQ